MIRSCYQQRPLKFAKEKNTEPLAFTQLAQLIFCSMCQLGTWNACARIRAQQTKLHT